MPTRYARSLSLATALVFVSTLAIGCSDDDDPVAPSTSIVGSWNATSFTAQGIDLIALGMSLSLTLSANDTYTLQITDAQVDLCDGLPDCTETGTYTSTATTLTIDPGSIDETVLNYTIQGSTLTLTGAIDGTPVVITFARTS